jgi:hypothetical protein
MQYSFYTISILIAWLISGAVTALIAKQKNRNPIAWFFIGLLFGVLGILAITVLAAKPSKKDAEVASVAISEARSESALPADSGRSHLGPVKRIPTNKSLQWYYLNKNVDTIGPLTVDDLRRQIFDNKLDGSTYIWCEEFADWSQISEFQNNNILLDPDLLI